MKRLLFILNIVTLLLWISTPARGDTIVLSPSGPVVNVGQLLCPQGFNNANNSQLSWGATFASGPCSINNNYIFAPLYSQGTACFYVYNKIGSTRQFTSVIVATSADPNDSAGLALSNNTLTVLETSSGNAGTPSTTGPNGQNGTIGPLTTPGISGSGGIGIISVPIGGAALIEIQFNAVGGSTGGLLLFIAQTQGPNCGGNANWTNVPTGVFGGANGLLNGQQLGADPAFWCSKKAFVNNAAAGSTLLVTGIPGLTIRVCSIVWAQTPASTFKLNEGTGATCGTGPSDVSGTQPTTAVSLVYVAGPGAPYVLGVQGDSLCATLGTAMTSGTIEVHYGFF